MPKFKVCVNWIQIGEFDVEADTLEEAMQMVEDDDGDKFPLSAANGEYLDDSFEVNKDVTVAANS